MTQDTARRAVAYSDQGDKPRVGDVLGQFSGKVGLVGVMTAWRPWASVEHYGTDIGLQVGADGTAHSIHLSWCYEGHDT